jgi:hypothetical protein
MEIFDEEFDKRREEIEMRIINTMKKEDKEDEKEDDKAVDSIDSNSEMKSQLKKEILRDYIYPDNKETIQTLLTDRKNFAILLQIIRSIKVFMSAIIVSALLISDTQFPGHRLGYIATILSCVVSGLEITDRIIIQVNKKRSEKINSILLSLGIKYQLPETTLDDPTTSSNEQQNRRHSAFISGK